jgi:hypothetical protein
MNQPPAISLDSFNDILKGLAHDVSQSAMPFTRPFARVVSAEDHMIYLSDYDLELRNDSETGYVERLRSLGYFLTDSQVHVLAVFIVGLGVYQPHGEDDPYAYHAILISGQSIDGLQGTGQAIIAGDGTLNPFDLDLAAPESPGSEGFMAAYVLEGMKRRSATLQHLALHRN